MRKLVAKSLKSIFHKVNQSYGGWVSRLGTDEGMGGLYEVNIFTRSYDINVDERLNALWVFMADVLDVQPEDFETELMSNEVDPNFKYTFIIEFPDGKPSDWSDRNYVSEMDDSTHSIESVQELA